MVEHTEIDIRGQATKTVTGKDAHGEQEAYRHTGSEVWETGNDIGDSPCVQRGTLREKVPGQYRWTDLQES